MVGVLDPHAKFECVNNVLFYEIISISFQMESKIHRDRVAMVSKQLEVKEAATRQKLLDFREKLLQAKNGLSHSPINAFGENSGQSKQPISCIDH